MKSDCCNEKVVVNEADEGTCCYICTKCNKPCDIATSPSPEAWEIELNRVLSLSPYTKNNLVEIMPWLTEFISGRLSSSRSSLLDSIEAMVKEKIREVFEPDPSNYDDMRRMGSDEGFNQALSAILEELIKLRK